MFEANQGDIYLIILDFNKEIPNSRNTIVRKNTIPNSINTSFGIDVCHDIYLSFGLEVNSKA